MVRAAGRVLARRELGKLVFLDLVDRSARIQLLCDTSRTGPVDVDLGDIVGVTGRPARARRGEPSIAVDELVLLGKIRSPLPDTFHGVTDTGGALPQALPRPAHERGVAARRRCPHADDLGDPCLPRRRRLPRGRDTDPAASVRRRLRRAVRNALELPRPGRLPPHRGRALSQAADRRGAGEGLRALQGLSQRGRVLQALAGVHAARVVRGIRRLPRHDGAHRDSRLTCRRGGHRHDEGHVPRARDRARGAVAAGAFRRRAREQERVVARSPTSSAGSSTPPASTRARTRRGRSSSTTRTRTSSSRS